MGSKTPWLEGQSWRMGGHLPPFSISVKKGININGITMVAYASDCIYVFNKYANFRLYFSYCYRPVFSNWNLLWMFFMKKQTYSWVWLHQANLPPPQLPLVDGHSGLTAWPAVGFPLTRPLISLGNWGSAMEFQLHSDCPGPRVGPQQVLARKGVCTPCCWHGYILLILLLLLPKASWNRTISTLFPLAVER